MARSLPLVMHGQATNYGREVVSDTETYLGQIEDCVALLPELLDQYNSPNSHRDTVEQVRELESDCDRLNRQIAALITDAGPEETDLLHVQAFLNAPSLVSIYQDIDNIANTVERIAEELTAISPSWNNERFQHLGKMADCAVTAVTALTEAVSALIHVLYTPEESDTITDKITIIRDAESQCDDLRNQALDMAFNAGISTKPLLYREFAIHFDRLIDVMEDITDQIIIISNDMPRFTAEPNNH